MNNDFRVAKKKQVRFVEDLSPPFDESEQDISISFAEDLPVLNAEPPNEDTYYIRQTWDVNRFKSPDQFMDTN